MHESILTARQTPGFSMPERKRKPRREARDPYDGLRLWSALTHGAGIVLGAMGLAALLIRSIPQGDWIKTISFLIYGLSMICLYTASTLYHSVNTTVAGRIGLRKYDHCSIYLLIAGSYTPICMTVLAGPVGYGMLAAIWALAVAGLVVTILWIDAPRWVTSAVYLVMGWLAVFAIVPISQNISPQGFFWLLAGGISYTVGGVLYAVKWPGRNNPKFGCHEVFHLFILLGSVCHFILMYMVIVPY